MVLLVSVRGFGSFGLLFGSFLGFSSALRDGVGCHIVSIALAGSILFVSFDDARDKKVKALARRSALSYKVQENALVVVEDFTMEAPSTKGFVEILNGLNVADKKVLVVVAGADKNLYLSSRNLQKAKLAAAANINTYGILDANVMVVTESALNTIHEVLA